MPAVQAVPVTMIAVSILCILVPVMCHIGKDKDRGTNDHNDQKYSQQIHKLSFSQLNGGFKSASLSWFLFFFSSGLISYKNREISAVF